MQNKIEYCVYGRYGLFSDPIVRMGGEKCSYPIPTYQAIKGITESIYWKPTIIWIIDEVRVMHPIRTEAKNIRPISYNVLSSDHHIPKNTLSIYNYLVDVEYQVRAHFILNESRRGELDEEEFKEEKHYNIAKRMVEKGGRRDIFLGTRECQGYVEPCSFSEGKGYYDGTGKIDFGVMFHGFDYPDETQTDYLTTRFWQPEMINGVIHFLPPEEISEKMKRPIRPMTRKKFGKEKADGMDAKTM